MGCTSTINLSTLLPIIVTGLNRNRHLTYVIAGSKKKHNDYKLLFDTFISTSNTPTNSDITDAINNLVPNGMILETTNNLQII